LTSLQPSSPIAKTPRGAREATMRIYATTNGFLPYADPSSTKVILADLSPAEAARPHGCILVIRCIHAHRRPDADGLHTLAGQPPNGRGWPAVAAQWPHTAACLCSTDPPTAHRLPSGHGAVAVPGPGDHLPG
jgi:hypothetical protein